MNILHISDTHGLLIPLDPTPKIVIHTGDFLPSFSRGIRAIEYVRQADWIVANAERLRSWIGDRKLFTVGGNHDYVGLGECLRGIGIDAHDLYDDGSAIFEGHRMVGFPFVPAFTREWNYELEPPAMAMAVAELRKDLESNPTSILAMHSPIHGVLDRNGRGTRCGNTYMREMLLDLGAPYLPHILLCGHIHESNGLLRNWHGAIVSNAAEGQRRITL